MELLIPGLILVGLMIYASTRIKRNAAKAFEAETIETPDFVIRKADGMLHVLNGDPAYLFEAYSKDYGKIGSRDLRLATAVVEQRNAEAEEVPLDDVTETTEVIDGHRYHRQVGTIVRDGVEHRVWRKSTSIDGQTLRLEVAALPEADADFMSTLDSMVDSFLVKATAAKNDDE